MDTTNPSHHPAPRLLPLGDAAWTVEFGDAVDPAIHGRVLGFAALLDAQVKEEGLEGVIEWVPTFRSVTVHFDPERLEPTALAERLLALAGKGASAALSGCRWRIPVCFDRDFAPDLEEMAAAKGLAPEELVRRMTTSVFSVYMLGFLPGFAYLGGLPAALEMPRLATPRKTVAAGSLAVAGRNCAVYPCPSPGGWRLLGRTPIRLFDADRGGRPALLAPGDEVIWRAVERADYEAIAVHCRRGTFDFASLRQPGRAP